MLGKTSVNKAEHDALRYIGRALAHRGHTLHTTNTPGACQLVAEGYKAEGGTPTYISGKLDTSIAREILVFTDLKFQNKLDERMPDWRKADWLVFHNRKATADCANMISKILEARGTPLVDRGTS